MDTKGLGIFFLLMLLGAIALSAMGLEVDFSQFEIFRP